MKALKLKRILPWSGLFIFLFCSSLFSQSFVYSSHFPLGLNYNWKFNNGHFSEAEKIIDTMTFNGNMYFGVSLYQDYIEYWLREENNKIYLFNKDSSYEFLLYDFSADTGTSWKLPKGYACSFGTKIKLASKTDTVITPVGTFYNCYRFDHTPDCADAGLISTWFAKDIGKVRFLADNIAGIMDNKLESYSVVTSVEHLNKTYPDNFFLHQNYPNPFNPTTTIKFSIPNVGTGHASSLQQVTLKVYNLVGQEVATLISDQKPPGNYKVTFDGKNLASGVYFYQLQAGSFSQTKKFVLLK